MDTPSFEISKTEQSLGEDILAIGNTLINSQQEDVVKMDEHRFVAVFLPMFAGDEVQHYRDHGASIDLWRSIAGGPFKEVSICDKAGKELFRVPPLFNVDAVTPLDGTGQATGIPSIADMLARANLIAKQGPLAYETYMNTELARRSFMFKDKKDESSYISRWNAIFSRYKRPLIGSSPSQVNGTQANTNNNERPVDFDSQEFEPL